MCESDGERVCTQCCSVKLNVPISPIARSLCDAVTPRACERRVQTCGRIAAGTPFNERGIGND